MGDFLDGVKIREWIFVTPEYRMNDLIIHCNNKRQEILTKNLSIIDPLFQVVVHDIDNFQKEIPIALNGSGQKLHISSKQNPESNITQWKDQQIDLASNAIRKHTKRFPKNAIGVSQKVNDLTEVTIQCFLDREVVLRQWQTLSPADYDKFLILLGNIEREIKEKCMFPAVDNNELYYGLRPFVKNRLKENFTYLDDITLDTLMHGAIADWLLRCPLDFE